MNNYFKIRDQEPFLPHLLRHLLGTMVFAVIIALCFTLIRKSIKTLAKELDPKQFWQVHRGTIVNVNQIANVTRSFSGHRVIRLKEFPETLPVSRAYSHLFNQM